MSEPAMHERREYNRVIFKREVYLTLPNGKSRSSMSEDFSMYGMGLLTDEQLDQGQSLYLDFKILSHDSEREVNLRGKVVYSDPSKGLFKTGIIFY